MAVEETIQIQIENQKTKSTERLEQKPKKLWKSNRTIDSLSDLPALENDYKSDKCIISKLGKPLRINLDL